MADFYSTKELKIKTADQLEKILAARREKYRHMRFQVHSREIKNHREFRYLKREIARILTVINEKRKEPVSQTVEVNPKP